MKAKLRQTINKWRYLGYDKETLMSYETQVAEDNLKVFKGALIVAGVITLAEFLVIILFAYSGEGVTDSLWTTEKLLFVATLMIVALGIAYSIVRNRRDKAFYSRIFTTILLSVWSILYIIIGTGIDPEDYAVVACGLFLLIQVIFNAYPLENLIFVTVVYMVFAVMSYVNKSTMIFMYDLIDAMPFVLVGLFLSWTKSRSKWASLINADAMVKLETKELENELLQSRVSVMLSQIQPHFLYNSLTAIHSLCSINPMQAKEAIGDFSSYLRTNLDSINATVPITFERELMHVQTYLKLEKMRFEDELQIVCDIEVTDFMIPALTVQPLVENAVKYGVGKKVDGGTVTICTREYADRYEIIVSDDGVGFDPYETQEDGRSHIGIDNVKNRLWEMVRANLDIVSEKGIGTKATITIRKEAEHEDTSD